MYNNNPNDLRPRSDMSLHFPFSIIFTSLIFRAAEQQCFREALPALIIPVIIRDGRDPAEKGSRGKPLVTPAVAHTSHPT
jgi:hypothetical protein